MTEKHHKIKNKIWFYNWLKWLALILFILWLFCILFKCCDNTTEKIYPAENSIEDSKGFISEKPNIKYPSQPSIPYPIDTSFLEVLPSDPLKREIVSNIVNVYCQDTVNLKIFAQKTYSDFNSDSLEVVYFAEEYKRIQFKVEVAAKEELMDFLKVDTINVKYVLHEWVINEPFLASIPSDPGYSDQKNNWFYSQIGLFKAWDSGYGNDTIIIAVIDDSFDPTHTEFKGKFVKSWNVVDYNAVVNVNQNNFHGTHVAGTIGADMNNGSGISGVAPNCKLMPIQIADKNGYMSITSIIDAIFYALKNDADVINLSLGIDMQHLSMLGENEQKAIEDNSNLEEAEMWNDIYEIANKENVIIVQAAGNSATIAGMDPMKRSLNSIVVGAVDKYKKPAEFTNYGDAVMVYAPGVEIYSSLPDNEMGYLDGTSMACPIVAGCVALAKSKKPNISTTELLELISSTGENISVGNGTLIRIDKILDKL